MTLPGPLYTSANFRTHDSTPETLMPEGNKSRVSGGGVESTVHYLQTTVLVRLPGAVK